MSESEGNRIGRYRRIAHLATGGMAEVHLAALTGPRGFVKLVVIKQLLPELASDRSFVASFLDEARIASQFVHPNVVHTIDVDSDGDRQYIVMEYLSGENLASVLAECKQQGTQLPPDLAAWIVMRATEGLHHIHTRRDADDEPLGIVHRDVSPENVFVLYDGHVKIVDFGITLAPFRTTATRTGVVKGKLSYMSPEQVRGGKLDARSDLFSMGIVLWECLTGARLYSRDNEARTLETIACEDAPSPATRNPDLPDELCQIALKALARNPSHRFGSSAELRSALAGFLRDRAQQADAATVGQFMQDMFGSRIQAKARRVEQALSEGDLESNWMHAGMPGTAEQGAARTRKHRRLIALLALVVAAGTLATVLVIEKLGRRPPAEAGPGPAAESPAEHSDGSVPDQASKPEDRLPFVGSTLPDPETPPAETPVTNGAHRRTIRKRIPRNAPKTGRLRLMTTPWTTIFYQGEKLGQTPLIDVKLPAGVVKLRAVNDEAGIDRWITVRIKPGEIITRRHNFP